MNGVYVAGMPLHSIFDLVLGDEGTTVHLEMYQNTGKLLEQAVYSSSTLWHTILAHDCRKGTITGCPCRKIMTRVCVCVLVGP